MKIAIIGSGAIGCLFGGHLSKKNDVHMICRRQVVADSINTEGIVIYELDGSKQVYSDVKAYVSGQCDTKMDLVVVIVKSMDTDTSMEENTGLIGEDTLVMTLQNGGGNDARLAKHVSPEKVIIGITRNNCVNLGNGNIRHSNHGSSIIGTDAEGIDVESIARMFTECGLETEVSDNIHRIIWNKLFVNMTSNAFTAILKSNIGTMIQNENNWSFAEKLIAETIEVARAEGHEFSYDEVTSTVRRLCEGASEGFTSMSQDVMNCRKTEIDSINGFVVERAKVHGLPATYNEFVVNLIHSIEGTYEAQDMPTSKYREDDVILREGEENHKIYKVLYGSVTCYSDYGTDDEYLIGVLGEGKTFGDYSCLSGSRNLVTIVANEETIVMEIDEKDVHNYISVNPRNAEDMVRNLSSQVAMILKHIELLNNE